VSDPIVREEDAEPALVRIRAGAPQRRRPGLGMFGLCLGTALIIMEANVVNVAVPTIRAELHTSATTSLWVLDSYTLLLAVLLLSAGRGGGPDRGASLLPARARGARAGVGRVQPGRHRDPAGGRQGGAGDRCRAAGAGTADVDHLAVPGGGGVVFSLVQSSLAGWRSPSVLPR